ncbi:MAG: peptidyl-prolyl cis-trans isomerase [Desulfuromonadaceae bacterium]|nr:peptidyl-prolyl cis-trans isomerase [Desulfuromonadaceae bacterium]
MENNMPKVRLHTSAGDIVLELNQEKAPITVENFLAYVQSGFYDGKIFHRVIPGFMIQGGGMDAAMNEERQKTPIKNEAANGLKNLTGTIAMARTQVVDSATSQFFINVNDNDFLNYRGPSPEAFGYAVFGQVVEGMEVVHAIEKVPTTSRGFHQDVPAEPVTILHASVVED